MGVRRAMTRGASKLRTLYHFTVPRALPSILQKGIYPNRHDDANPQLPRSTMAIWLTSDPNGNLITDEHVALYRRSGSLDLVAECEAGRKFIFGFNENDGSVRLTVQLPRKFPGLCNYLQLMRQVYRDWPPAIKFLTEMPGAADWWVVISPAIAKTFHGIGPATITEVAPDGAETAAYLKAVRKIRRDLEAA